MGHYDNQEEKSYLDRVFEDPSAREQAGVTTKAEPVELPGELFDFTKVLLYSAATGKYEPNNWLKVDGKNCTKKSMIGSMARHMAEWYGGSTKDKDSGLHPLLHLAVRAMMMYTRYKKGLVHSEDNE